MDINEGEPPLNRQRVRGPAPNEFSTQPVFDRVHQNSEVLSPIFSKAAMTNPIDTSDLDVTSLADAEDTPSFMRGAIFQVILVKNANRNFTAQQYSRQNNSRSNQASQVNYDIAIYVRDVLSRDPSLCVIFHGSNANPTFFNADYGARSHIMSKLLI